MDLKHNTEYTERSTERGREQEGIHEGMRRIQNTKDGTRYQNKHHNTSTDTGGIQIPNNPMNTKNKI